MRKTFNFAPICLSAFLLLRLPQPIAHADDSAKLPALDANSKLDDVLDVLKSAGKDVKSFSADLQRTELDANDFKTIRSGKVFFQLKSDGSPVVHLVFDKKVQGKETSSEKKEYLIDNGWVTDRAYLLKTENRMQIAPPGEKMNLFQLGQGQMPLPIGQDKADVYKDFEVSKVASDKDDPAHTIHVLLKPKPGSPLESYTEVHVWVDSKLRMPVRIETDDKRGNSQVNDLLNMKVNPSLNADDVTLPPLPKDWRSNDTPLKG